MAAKAKNQDKQISETQLNQTRLNQTIAETPDMVQDYIASMLQELSDMARTSGLPHLSSLLQVSLLAANAGSKSAD